MTRKVLLEHMYANNKTEINLETTIIYIIQYYAIEEFKQKESDIHMFSDEPQPIESNT